MKKLYIFFTILLVLTACSSENIAIDNEEPEVEPVVEVKGIQVELTDPVGLGDENITRSTIVYDDAKDIMAFKWGDTDCIGVFTYPDAEHSQQQKFSQVKDPSDSDHLRTFQTQDGALHVNTNYQYVSCFPECSNSHAENYTNIPVSYLGQRQTEPVDFSNYWNDENDEGYKESQEKASAHLPAYDFQCTGVTKPTPTGGIHFKMNRMGAIVRFWIVIDPENNYVYDELQLVNRTKQFTTKATMDAENQILTSTGQSHIVNLQLGNAGEGFDMTDKTNDETKSTTPFYDWYDGTYTGYLMLYMMLAPIDLKGTSNTPGESGYVENCFIYLVAHEKGHPENKHYFKSPGLSKPNLKPNTFYKWTIVPNEDTPIEMESITVEEWRTGVGIENNGKDGTKPGSGTETW